MDTSNIGKSENKSDELLADIKKDIENAYQYFGDNYKTYNEFYRFVFKTALDDADVQKLKALQKPPIEFPILEAYISRLKGEFAKQAPQIDVHAAEGMSVQKSLDEQYVRLLKVLQAHLNEIFFEANNDEFQYDVYSDTLAGGFSVAKITTDYVNEKSFLQKIGIERVYNPTLCGFDPLATKSHKGDGRYCFELYPMTKDEFEQEFGKDKAKGFKFSRSFEGFNWTYKNLEEKIVLVAEYFVKKTKPAKIFLLADDATMTEKEYKEMVENWDNIEQPPAVVDERKSTITSIWRYRLCQNEILEETETFYPMLPLIFFDGNSVMIQNAQGGNTQQMTRPFVYNAKGVQRLKNFSGQTVGAEIENMVMHKFKAAIEGIPKQYEGAYKNPQQASILVYNQFSKDRPNERIDPPMEIQRTPTPPIVQETFMGSDATTQAILGSYDAILGVNGKQISGVAIQQGAMQSNAAAIPYLMGYVKGLQRCAEVCLHLIPLIYVTPRSIPIRRPDGKRDYQVINAPYPKEEELERGMGEEDAVTDMNVEDQEGEMEEAIMFNYDPNEINVRCEPGVNADVAKQLAIEQLISISQAIPAFAEFMNQYGIDVILDNLDIRGIDGLKEMAEQYKRQLEKQREEAENEPSSEDKMIQAEIEIAKMGIQVQEVKAQNELLIGLMKAATEREKVETDRMEVDIKAAEVGARVNAEEQKAAAQEAETAIETTLDVIKMQHDMNQQRE